MRIFSWSVPALGVLSSCSTNPGTLDGSSEVTTAGGGSMSAAILSGGTGGMALGGAPGAGTTASVPASSAGTSMGGATPLGIAGSPSAGAGGAPNPGAAGAAGQAGAAEMPAIAGTGGTAAGGNGAAGGSLGGADNTLGGAGGETGGAGAATELISLAAGFDELFLHDACTGVEASQPDTCIHEQLVEESFTFGGAAPAAYAVTLRVRGLFEPTTITGGEAPLAEHPYFRVGGTVSAVDYSQWQIEISDPPQTFWLNHYPSTSHTIYQEDFEATLEVSAAATVTVRVVDGNNRQIDNSEEGLDDRRQLIEGVTDEVLDGQMLRLDVVDVVPL